MQLTKSVLEQGKKATGVNHDSPLKGYSLDGYFTEIDLSRDGTEFSFAIHHKHPKTGIITRVYWATYNQYDAVLPTDNDRNMITFEEIGDSSYTSKSVMQKHQKKIKQLLHSIMITCGEINYGRTILEPHMFSDDDQLMLVLFTLLYQLESLYAVDSQMAAFQRNYRFVYDAGSPLRTNTYTPQITGHYVPVEYTTKEAIMKYTESKEKHLVSMKYIIKGHLNWNMTLDTYRRLLKSGAYEEEKEW